jgi:branched-chain amino acid transport system ATP-binding protein
MTEPLLDLRKLSAGYGAIRVLEGVEMRVEPGSLTAVLGPNGAGKSTLFKAILGLVKVTDGTIVYKGRDIEHDDTVGLVRAGLSLVPEGRGLFPPMTVRDNLLLGAFTRRRDRPAVRSELERVVTLFPVLEAKMKMPVSSLSGGQQQMVAIGRALMGRPDVLLLDEPSLGLAPIVFQQVVHSLDALRSQGRTILLAEQNVRTAVKYADYVYLMRNGTVVAEGDATSFADLGAHGIGYLAGHHGS